MRESEHDKIRQRYTPRIPYQQQDKTNGAEVQSAIDYIQKIKMIYTEQSPIFMKFLEAMKDFKMTKISGTELYGIISKLFADKPHLINEFKSFIPPVSISNEESKFVEKINKPISSTYEFIPPKIRLKEREVINKFVDLLYHLKKKPLNPQKVNEFNALLNEYPEIISKLNKLTPAEKEEVYSPFDFITEKIKQLGIYKEFMKCINSYNQNLIGKEDLVFLVKQIIKEEKLLNEFIRFLNPGKVLEKEKEKYFGTVGSYRIIKDEPGGALINDYCVGCPTHNREDENYVFLKRNIFEENLFRIEDERYEIDLLCLRIESLIISLEKVTLTNLEEIGINQLEISSGIVQSILELIYKENYSEVLEGILSKPKETIPVVLNRLYRVNERIKREKIEKEKIWEEATKLNYYKALDNIYFDFKSTDKKELLFKNLSNTFVKNEFSLENLTSIHKKIIYFYQLSSGNNLEGIKLLNDLIEILNNSLVVICVNNTLFSIICYLIILTQRLSEIFTWELKELNYGKMNRELGLIDRMDVEDRIKEIFITIENLLEKKLDSTTFDEEIRILTDNKGYKLFSIDKIFSKLDNKVISVLGDKNIKEYFEKIYNFIITNSNINNEGNNRNIELSKNINNSTNISNIEQSKYINNELSNNINNEGNNEIKNEEIIDGKSNTNINNETKNEEVSNNNIKNEEIINNEINNTSNNSNNNESNIIDKYLNNSLFKYSLKLFDEIELEEYFIMELIDKSITFHKIERKLVKNEKNQIVNKIRNLDFDEKNIKSKVFLDRTLRTYNEGIYQLDLEHRFCFNTNTLRHIAGTHDFFMRGDHKRNNKK